MTEKEAVNHPPHYNHGGMETIDIIKHIAGGYPQSVGFSIGTVVKYLDRAPYKDNLLQDLEKAEWYLKDAIKTIEGAQG
ncbi:DUF3310 domain-containing protein [Sporolactobacillus terrae]|uniref:DUF3310 domain-containing protein n=1 Tax=Sporolactobacillus terrae TaxID=269673 RepID=UPI00049039FC|nr:DUF3310 domain-containing protein [Sporolactobacillus terrae]